MTRRDLDAEALFRAHAGYVASFLFRLGVELADVDDQVQEVFVIAHTKGGYTAGPATPRTWLGAIAVRVASHYRRSRGRRRDVPDAQLDARAAVAHAGTSPEHSLVIASSLDRVQRALDELEDSYRAVFVLYEIENHSCAEIADALEVPVGTVYSRLHAARSLFREAHARLLDADERPRDGEGA